MAELRATESCALQVLNEQKINMEQLILQCDELVSQNQQLVHVIGNTYRSIPELAIPADVPAEVWIHRLVARVREAMEETTKVQLELNLQIAQLRLKVQPSTPLEVRKQCTSAIIARLEEIGGAVRECTNMLQESLEVLTTL